MSRSITAAVTLAIVLPALSASAAEPPIADGTFVTAHDGRLWLGAEEFRFVSFNVPNLHYVEDDLRFARALPFRFPDEYEITDALESIAQIGGRVVRIYALAVRKESDPVEMPRHVVGPGRFDEAAFRALDTVLEVARRKGVRVVIPLVDNWSWWGGVGEYAAFRGKRSEAFWSDPQVIADFESTVRFVVTRVNTRTGVAYRDDPAILAWETGNELHAPPEWTRRIAAAIKRLDPNHLVIDGRQAEVLERESIADPHVDLLQTHHYEKSAGEMIAHVRASAEMARGGKPYHVGELGFLDTAGMTAVLDAVIAEGLAGALVWSLRGHDRDGGFYWHQEPSGGDLFKAYHWPGFASGEAYDETRLLRELRRRAFAIRGEQEPAPEAPAAPRIVAVTDGGLITWRGSAGASAYTVERRDSAAAPWQVIAGEVSDAAVQYRPLLCDESAAPGHAYAYRVVARNEAGASPPSPAVGPVLITHRTVVDELADASRMVSPEGELVFSGSRARTVKEDAHTLSGGVGAAFVYRCETPISGGRVLAFAEKAGDHPAFSASTDGARFAPLIPKVEVLAAGDAATYGYWLPSLFRLGDLPVGTRYVRIEPRGAGVRVSRIELDHGEEKSVSAATLREVIEGELRSNLLPFWRERGPDAVRGGFIAEMASDGTLRPEAAKGLVLNARLLWTHSALYRRLGEERDLELARRAFAYLEAHFRDRVHGGYRWRVAPDGAPLDEVKKVYGQAFCIYALAEYVLASGDPSALAAARQVFELVERHARDGEHGGYLEARAADWSATAELRLGDGDPLAAKSMNTHLHLLEAYTNLYRAWPDPLVAARLAELIDLFGRHIVGGGAGPGSGHLISFFDERWQALSSSYTYGHDIEAAWLLCEAADALGDGTRQEAARGWAVGLARAVLAEAVDADGALAYEGRDGAVIDGKRDWWCQAEAVVGFWHAFQMTADQRYATAATRVWAFIASRMVDRIGGEWFWRVGADGLVDESLPKVSEWKCPYHTVRMALEMMQRLGPAAREDRR
jgi:mannan endo-1,4-beta-mannosidase